MCQSLVGVSLFLLIMNRDIHDELLNQSILNKEKLITHLLKEYLGKEPVLEDYKKVTLGTSNHF